jgi:hypothetical protein
MPRARGGQCALAPTRAVGRAGDTTEAARILFQVEDLLFRYVDPLKVRAAAQRIARARARERNSPRMGGVFQPREKAWTERCLRGSLPLLSLDDGARLAMKLALIAA